MKRKTFLKALVGVPLIGAFVTKAQKPELPKFPYKNMGVLAPRGTSACGNYTVWETKTEIKFVHNASSEIKQITINGRSVTLGPGESVVLPPTRTGGPLG